MRLSVGICPFVLFCQLLLAQATPQPMKTLLDVKRGMARDQVLAGLADKFALENEDLGVGKLQAWSAHPKKPSEGLSPGEIVFEDDKVTVVRVIVTPDLGADAVRLARELFFMLQAHAKPPAAASKAESFLNVKRAFVPVEVQNESSPSGDTQMIRFDLDNVQLEVNIQHKSGQSDAVWVVVVH